MILPAVLLVLTLAALVWFQRGDLAEYRLFQRLLHTEARQGRYRLWLVKSWLLFAVPSLIGLALLGRPSALIALPREFEPLAMPLRPYMGDLMPLLVGAAIGLGIASLILALTALIARWRERTPRFFALGDISSILPRNRRELGYGLLLAITAGTTEELMFRLFLPLLVTLVSGSALAGLVVSVAAFGAMHRYQGWIGVIATAVLGLGLACVYLGSGALWLAIALHILIDVNGLVVRPLLGGAWKLA